jgi:hypothetical protein
LFKAAKIFNLTLVVLFVVQSCLYAQAPSYDKYGYDERAIRSSAPSEVKVSTIDSILDSPAYSVRLIKEVLRKGVVWLEDYHVIEKAKHLYETITDWGIYPYRQDIGDRHENPPGIESSYGIYPSKRITSSASSFKLANIQYVKNIEFDPGLFSRIQTRSWFQYAPLRYKDYGTQITLNDFAGDSNYLKSTIRYHDNPQEDFFGEGPDASLGDGAAFSIEEFSLTTALGREFINGWSVETGLTFSTSDISDAKDNKKRPIHAYPTLQGIGGANIVSAGLSVEHDTRNNSFNPRYGGYQRLKLGYYEGIDGYDFSYIKTRFDLAEYIPIGQIFNIFYYDSVLALRVSGEFNEGLNGDKIPFFDLARLGGGDSLRSYQHNRFFDDNSLFYSIEYRYNIWGMKNYKADATVFFDMGWVFDEFSTFEIDKFRDSYGIGLRILLPRFTLAIEGAHGSEGAEIYLKMNPNF